MMANETILTTLEQTLNQTRQSLVRKLGRLAEVENEADTLRAEIHSLEQVVRQTENLIQSYLNSMFGTKPGLPTPKHAPSDSELEAILAQEARLKSVIAQNNRSAQGVSGGQVATLNERRPHEPYNPPHIIEQVEPASDIYSNRTIPQAALMVLRAAGEPLHVNEIYNRLRAGGFEFSGHNPTISIAVSLNRNTRFRKVSPGTFDLTMRDAASQAS